MARPIALIMWFPPINLWSLPKQNRDYMQESYEEFDVTPNAPEPEPIKNEHPAIWPLVIKDMADRDLSGLKKYGTRLQPHNGRKNLIDAYQEALDLAVYLRAEIYEQTGK